MYLSPSTQFVVLKWDRWILWTREKGARESLMNAFKIYDINFLAHNHKEIVSLILQSLWTLGWKMSLKLSLFYYHYDFFLGNLGYVSDEYNEQFQQVSYMIGSRYQNFHFQYDELLQMDTTTWRE